MTPTTSGTCCREKCEKPIPAGLAGEQLCVDHFLDEAFVRSDHALENCRRGFPVQEKTLEWLLSDALAVVQNLEAAADTPDPNQRDRMLELLLALANLHEYVAHHSIPLHKLA